MIARIRKSLDEKDKGFTLIELLVVIIIIGILAAIAIPIFLSQRKKAVDAAAKADITTIAKDIATYYVDNDAAITGVTGSTTEHTYKLEAGSPAAVLADADAALVGPSSLGAKLVSVTVAGTSASDFTVTLSYNGGTAGDPANFVYDAAAGLSGPTA